MNENSTGKLDGSSVEVTRIMEEEGLSSNIQNLIRGLLELSHIDGLKMLSAYQRILKDIAGLSISPASFGGGGGGSSSEEAAEKPEKKIFKVKITNTSSIEKLPAAKALQGELGVSLKEASDLLKEGVIFDKELPTAAADDLIAKLAQFKVIAEKV